MSTLADLTPEQLDDSRGMWVESNTGTLGIIRKTLYSVHRHSFLVQVLWPAFDNAGGGHTHFTPLDMLTLRDDLPRAWTPQGEPVLGEWEHDQDEPGAYAPRNGARTYRRFVTDWEPHRVD